MSQREQNNKALGFSVLVHGAIVLLIYAGSFLNSRANAPLAEGVVIEASLVDLTTKPNPNAVSRPRPPVPKPPTPKPVETPKQTAQPDPEQPEPAQAKRSEDTVNQEKVKLAADALEKAEKEQEERIQKEQIDLTQPEDELAKMERERQKQLDDIRKMREEAEKKRKLEEQALAKLEADNRQKIIQKQREEDLARMAAMADQEAQKSGAGGTDTSLRGQYVAAIRNKVRPNWLRPETAQNVVCVVRIIQLRQGAILSASIVPPCYADEPTRRSMEAAVLRSDPLPYKGYESVFERQVDFEFCYPESLCKS